MDPHSSQDIFIVILFWFKHLNIENPWCMPKSGGSSFIEATKRGGPGKEGQGQSLVDLGTASQGLMDREAVAMMSGLHQMSLIS